MKARSCAALASGKSDSSVVSAYAEEGNVILFFFFFPEKPSEARQRVRKRRSLRRRFGVKFCRFALRRGRWRHGGTPSLFAECQGGESGRRVILQFLRAS